MTLHQTGGRRRSTFATPYDRDSEERQREPIPRALPDVGAMYTICSLFAICSIPRPEMSLPKWQHRTIQAKRQNRPKNKRLAGGRGASHGRFPKEKRCIYTKFMRPVQALFLIISSHGGGRNR